MSPALRVATFLSLAFGSSLAPAEPSYRVVVALKNSGPDVQSAERRIAGVLDGRLGRVTSLYSSIPALSAVVTREGWAALRANSDVARVDLDEGAEVTTSKISATARSLDVQKMGLTGKGVTVAVVDTGVDSSHRDLAGVIIDEACFCMNAQGQPCCPNGTTRQLGMGSASDDNGHGTHLAGIIAGRGKVAPRGLAPEAYLISVKIADSNGSTSTWSMLAALDWLATSRKDVQVVNMSLGTSITYPGSCDAASAITSSLAAAAQTLRSRGVVIVAAAGNAGLTDRMSAPACVTGFLSVGALQNHGDHAQNSNGCIDVKTADDKVACFSNSSSALGLLAPGAGIVSTNRGGGMATGSGTSQAAAVVSGAVALLIEGAPKAGSRVDAALQMSGVSVTDSRNGRATPRLDVRAALTALGAM